MKDFLFTIIIGQNKNIFNFGISEKRDKNTFDCIIFKDDSIQIIEEKIFSNLNQTIIKTIKKYDLYVDRKFHIDKFDLELLYGKLVKFGKPNLDNLVYSNDIIEYCKKLSIKIENSELDLIYTYDEFMNSDTIKKIFNTKRILLDDYDKKLFEYYPKNNKIYILKGSRKPTLNIPKNVLHNNEYLLDFDNNFLKKLNYKKIYFRLSQKYNYELDLKKIFYNFNLSSKIPFLRFDYNFNGIPIKNQKSNVLYKINKKWCLQRMDKPQILKKNIYNWTKFTYNFIQNDNIILDGNMSLFGLTFRCVSGNINEYFIINIYPNGNIECFIDYDKYVNNFKYELIKERLEYITKELNIDYSFEKKNKLLEISVLINLVNWNNFKDEFKSLLATYNNIILLEDTVNYILVKYTKVKNYRRTNIDNNVEKLIHQFVNKFDINLKKSENKNIQFDNVNPGIIVKIKNSGRIIFKYIEDESQISYIYNLILTTVNKLYGSDNLSSIDSTHGQDSINIFEEDEDNESINIDSDIYSEFEDSDLESDDNFDEDLIDEDLIDGGGRFKEQSTIEKTKLNQLIDEMSNIPYTWGNYKSSSVQQPHGSMPVSLLESEYNLVEEKYLNYMKTIKKHQLYNFNLKDLTYGQYVYLFSKSSIRFPNNLEIKKLIIDENLENHLWIRKYYLHNPFNWNSLRLTDNIIIYCPTCICNDCQIPYEPNRKLVTSTYKDLLKFNKSKTLQSTITFRYPKINSVKDLLNKNESNNWYYIHKNTKRIYNINTNNALNIIEQDEISYFTFTQNINFRNYKCGNCPICSNNNVYIKANPDTPQKLFKFRSKILPGFQSKIQAFYPKCVNNEPTKSWLQYIKNNYITLIKNKKLSINIETRVLKNIPDKVDKKNYISEIFPTKNNQYGLLHKHIQFILDSRLSDHKKHDTKNLKNVFLRKGLQYTDFFRVISFCIFKDYTTIFKHLKKIGIKEYSTFGNLVVLFSNNNSTNRTDFLQNSYNNFKKIILNYSNIPILNRNYYILQNFLSSPKILLDNGINIIILELFVDLKNKENHFKLIKSPRTFDRKLNTILLIKEKNNYRFEPICYLLKVDDYKLLLSNNNPNLQLLIDFIVKNNKALNEDPLKTVQKKPLFQIINNFYKSVYICYNKGIIPILPRSNLTNINIKYQIPTLFSLSTTINFIDQMKIEYTLKHIIINHDIIKGLIYVNKDNQILPTIPIKSIQLNVHKVDNFDSIQNQIRNYNKYDILFVYYGKKIFSFKIEEFGRVKKELINNLNFEEEIKIAIYKFNNINKTSSLSNYKIDNTYFNYKFESDQFYGKNVIKSDIEKVIKFQNHYIQNVSENMKYEINKILKQNLSLTSKYNLLKSLQCIKLTDYQWDEFIRNFYSRSKYINNTISQNQTQDIIFGKESIIHPNNEKNFQKYFYLKDNIKYFIENTSARVNVIHQLLVMIKNNENAKITNLENIFVSKIVNKKLVINKISHIKTQKKKIKKFPHCKPNVRKPNDEGKCTSMNYKYIKKMKKYPNEYCCYKKE